jgi:hypothetical protein
MQAALKALRNSRAELETATPDKAGHRVKAIGLVDQAIAEVQAGIVAGANQSSNPNCAGSIPRTCARRLSNNPCISSYSCMREPPGRSQDRGIVRPFTR